VEGAQESASPRPSTEGITIDPIVVFEEPDAHTPEQAAAAQFPPQEAVPPVASGSARPMVAIIIDDMGYHQQLGNQLLALDLNLTFSFLPAGPFTAQQASLAKAKGREILLHLPMEPKNTAWNPGENALYVRDTPERLRQKMARMFNAVPHATGANNHMGSRFTADAAAMRVVLDTLKEHSFYFIDSYTARGSQGLAMAQELGVPAARRHIFLDNVQETETICRQIDELVAIAQKKGAAIAIGHPNRATLRALTECGARLRTVVEIVSARQLVQ
jgi:polysaccharide deacetylase 2 family uncharacterized protein YibQ